MKEVELGRYAGPFTDIPFDNYVQSPIGLVPKDNGRKTRLIFHLSYPKDGTSSVNYNTPKELSKVNYPDFDEAVRLCIIAGKNCAAAKSDLQSAFRQLGIKPEHWKYLVMKAQSPFDQKIYYFVDKAVPFGASISCAHFQAVSDAIAHLVEHRTGSRPVNYLDDYFFAKLLKLLCDNQVRSFLQICAEINFPVSMEKTQWGTHVIVFLGLLIDTINQRVRIPADKIQNTISMIDYVKNRKKITLLNLQQLCGTLNFLCKCIVPGRAFTRRIYAAGSGLTKPLHHLWVTEELKLDLNIWEVFLKSQEAYSRPFLDYRVLTAYCIGFYTDASLNPDLGCGGVCGDEYFIKQWDEQFIKVNKPSIAYLELYDLVVGVMIWGEKYQNKRILLNCDNMSVVYMVNNSSSRCPKCMILIRILTLQTLIHNIRLTVKHVPTKLNSYADHLSRMRYNDFRSLARRRNKYFHGRAERIPDILWPMEKVWC